MFCISFCRLRMRAAVAVGRAGRIWGWGAGAAAEGAAGAAFAWSSRSCRIARATSGCSEVRRACSSRSARRAVSAILLDEERREPIGHLHRGLRIAGDVRDFERVALHRLDFDVAAHDLDDVLHRRGPAIARVEVEVEDDPLEARAAEDLLSD